MTDTNLPAPIDKRDLPLEIRAAKGLGCKHDEAAGIITNLPEILIDFLSERLELTVESVLPVSILEFTISNEWSELGLKVIYDDDDEDLLDALQEEIEKIDGKVSVMQNTLAWVTVLEARND